MTAWRLQFRLWYLLAAMLLACFAFGVIAAGYRHVAAHCAAVKYLQARGFHLMETSNSVFSSTKNVQVNPSWQFRWSSILHTDKVPTYQFAALNGREVIVTKEDLDQLLAIQTLQSVAINVAPVFDDEYASKLCRKTTLHEVFLMNTSITDHACAELCKLPELHYLNLNGTAVTDAGLINLASAPKLKTLFLRRTAATQAGVEKFQKMKPNCTIAFAPR